MSGEHVFLFGKCAVEVVVTDAVELFLLKESECVRPLSDICTNIILRRWYKWNYVALQLITSYINNH